MLHKTTLFSALVLFTLVVGYSFIDAAWTAPTGNPPTNNVAEPINEGPVSQTKSGALTVNGPVNVGSLASGPLLIDGDIRTDNPSPAVMLNDTDAGEKAFWVQANGNSLYVLADRANGISNPNYIGHDPWPLQIYAGATTSNDYATFSNEVRATQYCNRVGGNCFVASDVVPVDTTGFLNNSATAQSKAGSLTLSAGVFTAPRLTATTQVRSPQYCDGNGNNCSTAVEIASETAKTWGNRCTRQTNNATRANLTFTCPATEYLVDVMCSDEGVDGDCTITKAGYGGSVTRGGASDDGGMSILCCKD